mmetsp:Transcript_138799/g.252646  ORF Transcript_138799/g.252646 Transcript_138799/m.252646 type:complete len:172 (-) Transcript_138799:15-530(-)
MLSKFIKCLINFDRPSPYWKFCCEMPTFSPLAYFVIDILFTIMFLTQAAIMLDELARMVIVIMLAVHAVFITFTDYGAVGFNFPILPTWSMQAIDVCISLTFFIAPFTIDGFDPISRVFYPAATIMGMTMASFTDPFSHTVRRAKLVIAEKEKAPVKGEYEPPPVTPGQAW